MYYTRWYNSTSPRILSQSILLSGAVSWNNDISSCSSVHFKKGNLNASAGLFPNLQTLYDEIFYCSNSKHPYHRRRYNTGHARHRRNESQTAHRMPFYYPRLPLARDICVRFYEVRRSRPTGSKRSSEIRVCNKESIITHQQEIMMVAKSHTTHQPPQSPVKQTVPYEQSRLHSNAKEKLTANHHSLNAHVRGKKQECQRPVCVAPTSPSMTLLHGIYIIHIIHAIHTIYPHDM